MSTAANPFVLEKTEYTRDIAFLKHYVQDAAKYLMTMTGDSIEKCTAFVKDALKPGGVFEFKDPSIRYLERIDFNDRVEKEGTLLQYIAESVQNEELIAPTFTTYVNPKVKKSVLVDFVEGNIAKRSKAKREMLAAKMARLVDLESFKNSEQSNAKIANNAISGAHVSTSTILYNKTAHSTLTSNCRTTSGYGNANNEKLLSGNRHYYHPSIVINNIISIANRTDLVVLEKVMQEYNLHYPTPAEALKCVLYSTRMYWNSSKQEKAIAELLERSTPIERAAFVYVGDLYHLAMYNDQVMRDFIGTLATPVYGEHTNPVSIVHGLREEYIGLAAQLIPDQMKGEDWKKLKLEVDPQAEFPEKEADRIEKHRVILGHLANTIQHIDSTVQQYRSFIEAFLVTTNVPASLAYFPTSIRRSALTSDTDSTIFTVQDWVKWKTGKLLVDDESNAVAATMVFLAAESVTHILANMSANFGIESKRIHVVNMKNEYKFDVFVPTQVGKHYFAYIGCQEGNLNIEYEMEIKGVHLKSSNVPAEIMKKAVNMMRDIMDTAAQGKMISIAEKLAEVAEIEKGIITSILAGENKYLRSQQIKPADSYAKGEEQSPYAHHLIWEKVFAKKYGSVDKPPYSVSKVPVYLPNNRSIQSWLENIKDDNIRLQMTDYFKTSGRKTISTMMLPQQRLGVHGIPEEIVQILDTKRCVLDNTACLYLVLECLGYYCLDDKISELASDYH